MNEFTIHAGGQGQQLTLHIDWFNENNETRLDHLRLRILERDKPRTLVVTLNDVEVARIIGSDLRS